MKAPLPPGTELDEEFVRSVTELFEQKIVFNAVLGLKVQRLQADRAWGRIEMRHDLIGHFSHHRMHGGVISACLDAMGGLAVMASIGGRDTEHTVAQRMQRFLKLGTIDLRVDYLRPAVSTHFECHAEVLRLGSRVASTRMEMHDANARLVATGAGAYIVS
jgi:uncharacterized protein (TIGR00369 family)